MVAGMRGGYISTNLLVLTLNYYYFIIKFNNIYN